MTTLGLALFATWTLAKSAAPCSARPCERFLATSETGEVIAVHTLDVTRTTRAPLDEALLTALGRGDLATVTVRGAFVHARDLPSSLGNFFRVEAVERAPDAMRPLSSGCDETDAGAAPRLAGDLREARSWRAGEAPVPFEIQKATLDEILRRVRARARQRRADPALPKLVVMLDLDNTSFVPTARAHAGLQRIAAVWNIAEAADPDSFDLLPHYSKAGFLQWAERTGLKARYPGLDWNAVYNTYYGATWVDALDATETLVPGLIEFARSVSRAGGVLVFNTGRRESDRAVTERTLRENGLRRPKVTMRRNGFSGSTADWKVMAVDEIRAKWGEPVAFFDETPVNHAAMNAAYPEILGVRVSIPGFTTEMTDEALSAAPWRVSTYQR